MGASLGFSLACPADLCQLVTPAVSSQSSALWLWKGCSLTAPRVLVSSNPDFLFPSDAVCTGSWHFIAWGFCALLPRSPFPISFPDLVVCRDLVWELFLAWFQAPLGPKWVCMKLV